MSTCSVARAAAIRYFEETILASVQSDGARFARAVTLAQQLDELGILRPDPAADERTAACRVLEVALLNQGCACTEDGDLCEAHEALALVGDHLDAPQAQVAP